MALMGCACAFPDGTIGCVWEKEDLDGHAAEVLAWLDAHPRG